MERKSAEIWTGRGPFGALFFELYVEGEEVNSHRMFGGTYQDNCREVGREYAKEMSKRGCSEYAIINGKIPHGYPLEIQQGDIDTLVKAIGKKFKLVKSD